jgi:hypothetical protein
VVKGKKHNSLSLFIGPYAIGIAIHGETIEAKNSKRGLQIQMRLPAIPSERNLDIKKDNM